MFNIKLDFLDSRNFKRPNNIVSGLLDVVNQTGYSSEGHYFSNFAFAPSLNLREQVT